MELSSTDLEFLVGSLEQLRRMSATPVLPAFSERAVSFLAQLSRLLLRDRRSGVDVKSYAYWIRKASLEAAAREGDYRNRLGRGVALHIAPSNVPVNFAVSMTSSLLAGNCTVVRVSSKRFLQVDVICEAINGLLAGEWADLRPYLCVLRYEHNPAVTQALSTQCDLRVIWGGDRTIETIRQAVLPPRAVEMAFADRYSIAVIDADTYLAEDPEDVAKRFYTDTYYTDQNACSSPRLVVWLGDAVEKARRRFWEALEGLVRQDYPMKPIQAVDKLSAVCALGMSRPGVRYCPGSSLVVRVELEELTADVMDYKCGGGCFFEYAAKDLREILPILTKRCQTVAVLGVDRKRIREMVFSGGVRGVDRIVSLGGTMELSFIWDGFKMVESMSRYVYG
ncbi:MAG: long-chain-fatty-acyl-CoA reductase [Oscillibacter sp.]|nr:long-chain-fatty-acyl-CoA reductase [Oscillibacter sp.]